MHARRRQQAPKSAIHRLGGVAILGALIVACVPGQFPALELPRPVEPLPQVPTTERRFQLASTAIQNWPGEEPFAQLTHPPAFTFEHLASDVDVIAAAVEHYGIPWDEFAAGDQPPPDHPWTRTMTRLATEARRTQKDIFLQLPLARETVASKVVAGEGLRTDSNWARRCYDFGTTDGARFRRAYTRYVSWMVRQFQPSSVVVGVEINKFYERCGGGAAWRALVDVQGEAYQAAKTAAPSVLAFPSINLEDLYDQSLTGFDQGAYEALAGLRRDRFALSTYPSGLTKRDGTRVRARDLPADYFTRVRQRNSAEQPVVIAETGWNSRTMALGTPDRCLTALAPSDEAQQVEYLEYVMAAAHAGPVELVTWWSNRDLLPAPVMETCYPAAAFPRFDACAGDLWCATVNVFRMIDPARSTTGDVVYKGFGTMGIRDYAGNPKPLTMERWQRALRLPRVSTSSR